MVRRGWFVASAGLMTSTIACEGQEATLPALAWKYINRTIRRMQLVQRFIVCLFVLFIEGYLNWTATLVNRTHVEMWAEKHQAFWSVDHLHFPDKGLTHREPLNLLATAATCMAHVYRRCYRKTQKRFIYLQDGWKARSSGPTESPYHCSPRYWWEMAQRWKAQAKHTHVCVCVSFAAKSWHKSRQTPAAFQRVQTINKIILTDVCKWFCSEPCPHDGF